MVVGGNVFWSNGVWMGERESWRVDLAACLDSRLAVVEMKMLCISGVDGCPDGLAMLAG